MFRYDSLRSLTIKVVTMILGFVLMFMGPAFLIDRFSLGLFANGTMIGVSEVISYAITYPIVQACRRRLIYKWGLSVSTVCAVALLFLWDQSGDSWASE